MNELEDSDKGALVKVASADSMKEMAFLLYLPLSLRDKPLSPPKQLTSLLTTRS